MSDETPTPEAPDAAAAESAPTDQPGVIATAEGPPLVSPSDAAYPTGPVERPTVWSKFLRPLVTPIAVAAAIIFYVLNISRIFLANDDTLALVFASVVTVLILAGGTVLAAAPRVRSSSLTMILGGSLLVLLLGGMISIGAASPQVASGPVQCKPAKQKLTLSALNTLKFSPNTLTAKAGCVQISVKFQGAHTFQFDSGAAANAFPTLVPNAPTWAGTLPPGKYPFHCTVDGHAASGMVGTLTITS